MVRMSLFVENKIVFLQKLIFVETGLTRQLLFEISAVINKMTKKCNGLGPRLYILSPHA